MQNAIVYMGSRFCKREVWMPWKASSVMEERLRFVARLLGCRHIWKELLLDLKRRGLSMGPELAVADGALGFWQAGMGGSPAENTAEIQRRRCFRTIQLGSFCQNQINDCSYLHTQLARVSCRN
jgi:hypothetical protein